MKIKFDQYVFTISALTEFGVVMPSSFDIQDHKNGIRATAQKGFLYGDSRRPYPGKKNLNLKKLIRMGFNGNVLQVWST